MAPIRTANGSRRCKNLLPSRLVTDVQGGTIMWTTKGTVGQQQLGHGPLDMAKISYLHDDNRRFCCFLREDKKMRKYERCDFGEQGFERDKDGEFKLDNNNNRIRCKPKTNVDLSRHELTHCTTWLKCPETECDRGFQQQSQLDTHLRTVKHNGQSKFACSNSKCEKAFSDQSSAVRHEKTANEKVRKEYKDKDIPGEPAAEALHRYYDLADPKRNRIQKRNSEPMSATGATPQQTVAAPQQSPSDVVAPYQNQDALFPDGSGAVAPFQSQDALFSYGSQDMEVPFSQDRQGHLGYLNYTSWTDDPLANQANHQAQLGDFDPFGLGQTPIGNHNGFVDPALLEYPQPQQPTAGYGQYSEPFAGFQTNSAYLALSAGPQNQLGFQLESNRTTFPFSGNMQNPSWISNLPSEFESDELPPDWSPPLALKRQLEQNKGLFSEVVSNSAVEQSSPQSPQETHFQHMLPEVDFVAEAASNSAWSQEWPQSSQDSTFQQFLPVGFVSESGPDSAMPLFPSQPPQSSAPQQHSEQSSGDLTVFESHEDSVTIGSNFEALCNYVQNGPDEQGF